jgi:hypothetical protein
MTEQRNDKSQYPDAEDMIPAEEQRQEFRLTGRIWVDVEIEASDEAHEGRSIRCGSSDLSANGLRVHSPEPLLAGAILPLVVQLEGAPFSLTGEVKWCFPVEGQGMGYVAGFALYESDQTSILEWKEAIVRLLSL